MQNKLPGDPASLILGIIGLVVGLVICCCFPFISILPLGLSIWGLVMANKSMNLYRLNASEYTESSRSNVSIGRVLNILSIIMNGLMTLALVGMITIVGVAGIEDFRNEFKDGFGGTSSSEWEYEESEADDGFYLEEEVDSISTDSIFLNEVHPEGEDDE